MNSGSAPIWKRWLRELLPPIVARSLQRTRGKAGFYGDYFSWAEARRHSRGYDAPVILERVAAAARLVRDGHAAFERDSVAFAEPDAQWPLLACLLDARTRWGKLDVVDFGGSLGSLFFQHRRWLEGGGPLRWQVVEQRPFVELGQREFTNDQLSFVHSLDEAEGRGRPDGIILSSVLPYLEEPHALLRDIAQRGYGFVLIDRTGFVENRWDRLTIQRVPEQIYPASYPCWFFERSKLLRPFAHDYSVRAEFATADHSNIEGRFGGLYLERKR